MEDIRAQVMALVDELLSTFPMTSKHILVLGVSTSEVIGNRIGTSGSMEVAQAIFDAVVDRQKEHQFHLAFQCCEHLNRALVVEKKTQEIFHLPEVFAIPVPKAGGAMAAYAYSHWKEPVLVEQIQADAAIDIGNTLIGMHLKPVAVPIRPTIAKVGKAHVTMAKTRPKLIGGARAVYHK